MGITAGSLKIFLVSATAGKIFTRNSADLTFWMMPSNMINSVDCDDLENLAIQTQLLRTDCWSDCWSTLVNKPVIWHRLSDSDLC